MELVIFSYSYVEIFEKQIQKLSLSISSYASQDVAEFASVPRKIPN